MGNRKICNIGINDSETSVYKDGRKIKSYSVWKNMIERCYSPYIQLKYPTYRGCTVCEDWLSYSNFKSWFDENYNESTMKDWTLDKDIVFKGNKIYSPDTCFFVPKEINIVFLKRNKLRGDCPIGVYYDSANNLYVAQINKFGKSTHIGYYTTDVDAFYAYKKEKEKYIKELADKYKNEISSILYNKLYSYKIEITD